MNSTDVADLVAQMTLEEKCTMVRGETPWSIAGCERLGIPEWCVSDGPVGVRGRTMGPGLLMPGPSAIAATWNASLVEEVGSALGTECIDRKVDMLLAPTVNLHRSPRGGRHFESYSEDPELSSRVAVAFITGVQSQGVGACVKHFVANDQEFERHTIDVRVDERSLREIYLPPFEAAVKEAGVRAVMAAYNFVNGHHACAQPDLLVDILKAEWGFEGFVVSDWGAIKETVAPARHGLDLEMAGPGRHWGNGQLQAAVEAGDVDEAMVDDKVRRIVEFLEWAGRLGTPTDHDEASIERPEHRALARRSAAESMVLIRNERSVLPIAEGRSVALIGPGVAQTTLTGGGSASLIPHRESSVVDSMTERLGERLVGTARGIDMRRKAPAVPPEWIGADGVTCELFDGVGFDGECFETVTRPGAFNVWFGDTFPADRDAISVRMSFDIAPPRTGRYRMCALGYGHAVVFVDDEAVADNSVGRFSGGLGLFGGVGYARLEAGRTHRIRVEHVARDTTEWISMVDMGIELANVTREDDLLDAERLAARADVAVLVVGSNAEWESEGADRESIELPNGQDELVERVAAANPNTVVVLNCGAPMTLPWLDDVAAAVLAWYPGQEGGHAIADVLLGDADPGGRMPTTWARDERDTPSFLNYPGEAGVVRYGEGVFVGYRGYDARGRKPLIPFGHGGSYTTFEWGSPTVSGSGTDLVVEVPITNTGGRPGSEVVQIYIAPHDHAAPRPVKELAGFAKVSVEPGATEIARVTLKDRSFARWGPGVGRWIVDPGTYSVVVSASAMDERARVEVAVR
ncbi:MAG: glycoside hydrolase family 3 C-terminal domain-containing protein [Acidimicrobiales bacterium]|nr:glycoside hydrolase family 3 C-terminal domain-containing protein [Acidimicrobiales bacterium]